MGFWGWDKGRKLWRRSERLGSDGCVGVLGDEKGLGVLEELGVAHGLTGFLFEGKGADLLRAAKAGETPVEVGPFVRAEPEAGAGDGEVFALPGPDEEGGSGLPGGRPGEALVADLSGLGGQAGAGERRGRRG